MGDGWCTGTADHRSAAVEARVGVRSGLREPTKENGVMESSRTTEEKEQDSVGVGMAFT